MAETQRFGMTRFGGSLGGSLFDNPRFSNQDRVFLDRILAAFETHRHAGGERLGNPSGGPTLDQLPEGGFIPGGITLYYRVSFVDRYGLETAASPEVAITTPAPVAAPGAPVLVYAAGTLGEGTYYYALTAVKGDYETQLGPAAVITLIDPSGVELQLPALPAGADHFGVWRLGPGEPGYTKIGTASGTSVLDDGSVPADPCACDPMNMPPEENRTNATNMVTVFAPDPALVGLEGSPVKRWRVYRTLQSGAYDSDSLVAEVVETSSESGGGLVTEWTDTGADPGPGQPLSVSQTLTPSLPLTGGAGGSGPLLLPGDADTVWKVVSELDGALVTRESGAIEGHVVVLVSTSAQFWELTVDDQGALVSTPVEAVPDGAVVYPYENGPLLPSPDPTILYRLDVDDDGALMTTEV